jgi:hypothetical protein
VLMRLILVISLFEFSATVADFFPTSGDPLIALARIFIGLAWTASGIAFCICMRWFCQDTGLRRSARGWLKTTTVFCFAAVPMVISQLIMLSMVLHISRTGPSDAIPESWWILLLILSMAVPPLTFLLNILQMRREMRRREAF